MRLSSGRKPVAHDLVERAHLFYVLAHKHQPFSATTDLGDAQRNVPHGTTVDELTGTAAEFAALGQGIVLFAAKKLSNLCAAHDPGDLGASGLVGERGELEQSVERRVSTTDYGGAFTCIALSVGAEDVRDAIEDVRGGRGFAKRGQAVGAQRIGRAPGA